jgi:hypothetical protein
MQIIFGQKGPFVGLWSLDTSKESNNILGATSSVLNEPIFVSDTKMSHTGRTRNVYNKQLTLNIGPPSFL